jgi:hypothetical protein
MISPVFLSIEIWPREKKRKKKKFEGFFLRRSLRTNHQSAILKSNKNS